MSNASLKEQLAAVASKMAQSKEVKQSAKKPLVRKEKKPKPKWLDYVQYGVELLKAHFPDAFKAINEVRPLKKGIKNDLVLKLSTMSHIVLEDKACMVKSLSYYVNTMNYHKSVVLGNVRIDLEGHPAGEVTAEEAKYSADRYQAKLQIKKNIHLSPEE
jgi:ProP effector